MSTEAEKIKALKIGIETWRRTRTKLGPMPEELWDGAVSLCGGMGINPVSQALGLSYSGLKTQMARRGATSSRDSALVPHHSTAPQEFVELPVPKRESPRGMTTIELSRADGSRMMFRLETDSLDLAQLSSAFFR